MWSALAAILFASASPSAAPGRTEAVAAALASIEHNLTSTKYQHRIAVDTRRGVYRWDCSIMAAWILERAAPAARRAISVEKPLARDFYRAIERARTDRPAGGWQRLTDVAALRPGDLFAWLKPEMFKERANTGHVGFIVAAPRRHPKYGGVWLVRIADATTELHGDDSRPRGGEGGFGTATIAFLVDATGAPRAYGWYGGAQDPATFVPTEIVLGRVFKLGGAHGRRLDSAIVALARCDCPMHKWEPQLDVASSGTELNERRGPLSLALSPPSGARGSETGGCPGLRGPTAPSHGLCTAPSLA